MSTENKDPLEERLPAPSSHKAPTDEAPTLSQEDTRVDTVVGDAELDDAPDEVRDLALDHTLVTTLVVDARLLEVLKEPYLRIVEREVQDEIKELQRKNRHEDEIRRKASEKRLLLGAEFKLRVALWARHLLCTVEAGDERRINKVVHKQRDRELSFCKWALGRDGTGIAWELERERQRLLVEGEPTRGRFDTAISRVRKRLKQVSPSLARALAIPLGWALAPSKAKAAHSDKGISKVSGALIGAVVAIGSGVGVMTVAAVWSHDLERVWTKGKLSLLAHADGASSVAIQHDSSTAQNTTGLTFPSSSQAGLAANRLSETGAMDVQVTPKPLTSSPEPEANGILSIDSNQSLLRANERVTFQTIGEDPDGINRVEIYINGIRTETCFSTASCSVTVGPFTDRESINYSATMYDALGQATVTWPRHLVSVESDAFHDPPHGSMKTNKYNSGARDVETLEKNGVVEIVPRQRWLRENERLTFDAFGMDPDGIARVEILVDARFAEVCYDTDTCSVVVWTRKNDPAISYAATIYDYNGQATSTGYQHIYRDDAPDSD